MMGCRVEADFTWWTPSSLLQCKFSRFGWVIRGLDSRKSMLEEKVGWAHDKLYLKISMFHERVGWTQVEGRWAHLEVAWACAYASAWSTYSTRAHFQLPACASIPSWVTGPLGVLWHWKWSGDTNSFVSSSFSNVFRHIRMFLPIHLNIALCCLNLEKKISDHVEWCNEYWARARADGRA